MSTTTALRAAVDTSDLAYRVLTDLEVLFCTIEKETDQHTLAHRLAGIGRYLAIDWGNTLDCRRAELREATAQSGREDTARQSAVHHEAAGTIEIPILLTERDYASLLALADGPEQVAECAGSLLRDALDRKTADVSVQLTAAEREALDAVSAARYGGDAEWCASELLRQGLAEIVEGAR